MNIFRRTRARQALILLFSIAVLIFSCSTVKEKDLQQASARYQLGVSYLNDNNIQPAFVEFQKALELNPLDKDTHNAIGVIYLVKLEDYPKAIQHFREAIRIDKTFSEAANNLGNAYANIGRYDEAVTHFKAALSNPQYKNAAMAFNNIGMSYYRLGRFDEAIDAFKDALKRFSDFHIPYYGLALSLNAKGRYGEAANALSRAIQLDPLYNGDRGKAIEDFRNRKLRAKGDNEKDISDYIEIMNY